MRFVKPIDHELLRDIAGRFSRVVTVEDNTVMGGFGSAVAEALAAQGVVIAVLHLGLPDRFIDHGDPAKLLSSVGLDAAGIQQAIRNVISE